MATTLDFTPQMAFQTGVFAPGAKVYFYETGTTTPVVVYSDSAYTTAHASPMLADAAGVFPSVFYGGSQELKAVITAADDTAIATVDPVAKIDTTQTGASGTSFSAVTGNTADNVQDAIENVTGVQQNRSTAIKTFLEAADEAEARSDLGLGTAATRAAADTLADDETLPDGAAVTAAIAAVGLGLAPTAEPQSVTLAGSTSRQNTTSYVIWVNLWGDGSTDTNQIVEYSTDDSTWIQIGNNGQSDIGQGYTGNINFPLMPNHYYRWTVGTVSGIVEWRAP